MSTGTFLLKALSVAIIILSSANSAYSQRTDVRLEVASDRNKCSGLDAVYDFNAVCPPVKVKGYEPFYISHYGRHGSRYSYTSDVYTWLLDMIEDGEKTGNVTDYGMALKARLADIYDKIQYRIGDLTDIGWDQQKRMADIMSEDYPKAFGKGSRVTACASGSVRSIMSMSSFCVELSRMAPETDIIAHQGLEYIQPTAPNMGRNPFRYKGPELKMPYDETPEEFMKRRFPEYMDAFGRIFHDPEAALGDRSHFWATDHLYMLVSGMNSLTEDVKADFLDIFTPEEFVKMWEVDNYMRFDEYYRYRTSCSAIYDDMIEKADRRIASGEPGADLRFGHDHCLMTLLMIADLEGFGRIPADQDDLVLQFQTFRSPMAGNIQWVFYRPTGKAQSDGILVNILLNGENASVGNLERTDDNLYRWSDLRAWMTSRIASLVIRETR
ncbi:MAG: hypothetical protein ACI3ZC_00540 [Candidatus Cryptobacteroides sp.]